MFRRFAVLALACSVACLGCCLLALAQDSMCGQQILHPTEGEMYKYIDGFQFRVIPYRAVSNPIFEILFPTGLFIGPYVNNAGLNFKVSGCMTGTDPKAWGEIQTTTGTVTTKPIPGTITPGIPCLIELYRNDVDAKEDLRFPRREFGNVTADGNFFLGWVVSIRDSNNVVMNVGTDAFNHTASIFLHNWLGNMTLTATVGGQPGFTGFADRVDALVFDFIPFMADPHDTLPNEGSFYEPVSTLPGLTQSSMTGLVDPLHTKLGPSTYQINITFSHQLFRSPGDGGNSSSAYLLDVEGCLTYTGAPFLLNGTVIGYSDIGQTQHIDVKPCKITIRDNGGGIFLPKATYLHADIIIDHNHHVRRHAGRVPIRPADHTHETTPDVPLEAGVNYDLFTTYFKSLDVATTPSSLSPGTEVSSITFSAIPKNFGASSYVIRLDVSGLLFEHFDPGYNNESQRDFLFDVSGCGSVSNGIVDSLCSTRDCSMTLISSAAFSLSGGTCAVTLKKQSSSRVKMTVPDFSSNLVLTLGIVDASGNKGLDPFDADNYGQISYSFYGFTNVSLLSSSTGQLRKLSFLEVRGTTSTGISASSNPEVWITLPKLLGIQNSKSYDVLVQGCVATDAAANVTIPDQLGCEMTLKVPLTQDILAQKECRVSVRPGKTNPGLLINPPSDFAVSVTIATVSGGSVVDSNDPRFASYIPDDSKTDIPDPENPNGPNPNADDTANASSAIGHGATVLMPLFVLLLLLA